MGRQNELNEPKKQGIEIQNERDCVSVAEKNEIDYIEISEEMDFWNSFSPHSLYELFLPAVLCIHSTLING